jgi:AraC-like DNA-binding protein
MLYLPVASLPSTGFNAQRCSVLSVSPFLRELVEKVVITGALQAANRRHVHLAAVVWDEIVVAQVIPLALIQPNSPEAARLAELLERNDCRLDALADGIRLTGSSRRTIERAFVRETNLSLGSWIRKRRLLLALERMLSGESVADVAFALGYSGPSAFIAMFRRELGHSPTHYLAQHRRA